MHLTLSFFVLLASTLIIVSSNLAYATPIDMSTGMVTLPLKCLHLPRSDIHPEVLLQHRINRGTQRLAKLTGRRGPSDEQLRNNLHKRFQLLEHKLRRRDERRYNRRDITKYAITKGDTDGTMGPPLVSRDRNNPFGDPASDALDKNGPIPVNEPTSPVYIKYTSDGTAIPQNSISDVAKQPTAENSLGLSIMGIDDGYILSVSIGTPPREYKMLVSCGSADFWVAAEKCGPAGGSITPGNGGCGQKSFLGPEISATFVDTKTPWAITYGSGAVNGTIVTDNIEIAGLSLNKFAFGAGQALTEDHISLPYDGMMGTALKALSHDGKYDTPVELLARQGHIKEAITSYKLSRFADGKHDGEITFGGMDTTKFDRKTLAVIPNVSKTGYWEGRMTSVTVDGRDLNLEGRTAVMDTGTNFILASGHDAELIHNHIPGAEADNMGGFSIPCNTKVEVSLIFEKTSFLIDTRDIIQGPVDPKNLDGLCISGIISDIAMPMNGTKQWLIGEVFLKNTYFSTDVGRNQISFAKPVIAQSEE